MISGEIRRFTRDDGMIKVSRSLRRAVLQSLQAREKMTRILEERTDIERVIRRASNGVEEIVRQCESSVEVESIYKPIHQKEARSF